MQVKTKDANPPTVHKTALSFHQQRIIWPKMSIVSMLKSPNQDLHKARVIENTYLLKRGWAWERKGDVSWAHLFYFPQIYLRVWKGGTGRGSQEFHLLSSMDLEEGARNGIEGVLTTSHLFPCNL
jgi:hypothetical protein